MTKAEHKKLTKAIEILLSNNLDSFNAGMDLLWEMAFGISRTEYLGLKNLKGTNLAELESVLSDKMVVGRRGDTNT